MKQVLTLMLAAAVVAIAPPTFAQTTPPTTQVQIEEFRVERVLALTAIDSATVPLIPANILAAIQASALELREQYVFNPQTNTLTVRWFTVAPGSPNPTPPAGEPGGAVINSYTVQVDRIYQSTTPVPTLMFVGTVSGTPVSTPLGNLTGAPTVISLGYTTGTTGGTNPVTIVNVVSLVSGIASSFSREAFGTIRFTPGTVTPPGTTAVQAIVTPSELATIQSEVVLSGEQSVGTGLTYSWRSISGTVAIRPAAANTPTITVQFQGGFGEYIIELTVTDSEGRTSTARARLLNQSTRP